MPNCLVKVCRVLVIALASSLAWNIGFWYPTTATKECEVEHNEATDGELEGVGAAIRASEHEMECDRTSGGEEGVRDIVSHYHFNLSRGLALPVSLFVWDFEERWMFWSEAYTEPFVTASGLPGFVFYLSVHVGRRDELFVNLHLAGRRERHFSLRVSSLLLQLVDESGTGSKASCPAV